MATIVFEGRAAERLWRNIQDHPDLLPDPVALMGRDLVRRRRAELAAVAFMVTAAWGYSRIHDLRYGSRINRFVHLDEINRDVYRLTRSRGDNCVELRLRSGPRTIDLGPAIGFSSVLPLNPSGFLNYQLNAKAMSQLDRGDLVPSPYEPHSVRFALIAGLLDFRALVGYHAGLRSFPRTAHAVLSDLGSQIGRFLPRVSLSRGRGRVYATPHDGRHLPVILAPLSGRGMGGALLRTAGFRPEAKDARNNRVWVVDLAEINGRRVSDPRFKKLFKINRFIDRNR